jgi:hypothetical protein
MKQLYSLILTFSKSFSYTFHFLCCPAGAGLGGGIQATNQNRRNEIIELSIGMINKFTRAMSLINKLKKKLDY